MSGQVRFIGCLHLGHENMSKRRGFLSSCFHDKYLITQWNKIVSKGDVTYILGDVTMETKNFYPVLDQLQGIKKVILGNHDRPQDVPELLKYVNWVGGMYKYKHNDYGKFFLTHCPIHTKELDYGVSFNIHAHVHENSIADSRYLNVSAEVIDFTPKTIEELLKINK